ncbi:MAG: PQQ-dependent sugar dehydrogenase, partial [Woeseiaceae bacterium]
GQDISDLPGSVLRIDVDGGSPYAIPPDNPFVSVPGARAEIWAWGLRNPWRFSFDRATGDLFIGDVGQNAREEIDFQPASSSGGENYGWRRMEGFACFNPPSDCNDGTLTLPVIDYTHSAGNCSVTGGYRYRGKRHPQLDGVYVYADYCSGRVWGARVDDGGSWITTEMASTGFQVSTFGEDEDGEVYVASYDGSDSGVFRIAPTFPVCEIDMSQSTYADGETISATRFVLANPWSDDVAAELKVWLGVPGVPPISVLNLGAQGEFVLPSGFSQDFGPVSLFPVDPDSPRGGYEFSCRIVDPVRGREMAVDLNPFAVQ